MDYSSFQRFHFISFIFYIISYIFFLLCTLYSQESIKEKKNEVKFQKFRAINNRIILHAQKEEGKNIKKKSERSRCTKRNCYSFYLH